MSEAGGLKITVIVIAKNEQQWLANCLESVKWADQLIVADNGSTDQTLTIAKKYGAEIVKVPEQDFAKLRNQAMAKATGDWVIYVDADERVLAELKDELLQTLPGTDKAAFALSRRNIIFGQEENYGPFWPDWVIRVLKRDQFKGWVGQVHEHPEFEGTLGYSQYSLLHLTHRDIDHVVLKSLDWSKIDAQLRLQANHPPMSGWRFLRILFGELFYQGIKRRGFFNGTVGVMDSVLQTFSLFITYVRLWQLQQHPSIEQKYLDLDQRLRQDNFKYQ